MSGIDQSGAAFYLLKASAPVCSEATVLGRTVNTINQLCSAYCAFAEEPSLFIVPAPQVTARDLQRWVGKAKQGVEALLEDPDYLDVSYERHLGYDIDGVRLSPDSSLPEDTFDAVYIAIENILK